LLYFLNNLLPTNLTLKKRPKMSHFQFKFDPYRLVYAGEITDMALSELPSQRIDGSVIDDILVSHMSMADRIEMGTAEFLMNEKLS